MSAIGLVISGSWLNAPQTQTNFPQSPLTYFAGLVYNQSTTPPFITDFSPLELNNTKFKWVNLSNESAMMVLIDPSRQLINLPYTTNQQVKFYLALEFFKSLSDCNATYLPLKMVDGNLQFVDELPDNSTVSLEVPAGISLKWNDVRTRSLLKVNDSPLISQLNTNLQCIKIFLTPFDTGHQLLPDVDTIMIGSSCDPNCIGKKCNQYNGCGSPCGCFDGQMCNVNGECVNIPPLPICESFHQCGYGAGKCGGKCNSGSICQRNIDGFAECLLIKRSVSSIIWFVLSIIVLIFFIVVIIMTLNELLRTNSRPTQLTDKSYSELK
jgi:hypothetical protein